MKAIKNIIAIAAMATMTACTADQNIPAPANPADAVSINTMVSNAPGTDAATTTTAPYAPTGGTFTLLYSSIPGGPDKTAAYTYAAAADGTAAWVTDNPLYWDNLDAMNTAAPSEVATMEYPFFAAAPAAPVASPAVPTNQADLAVYTAADQLIAYTTTTARRETVNFTLRHVLSQISVKLTSATVDGTATGSPIFTPAEIAAATLTIAGAKTAYTMSYAAPTTAVPATATATGTAAGTDAAAPAITPHKAAPTVASFYAIVPPQTIAAVDIKLTFTIASETYTWTASKEMVMAAGNNYLINITAKKSATMLGTIDVVAWTDNAAINEEVHLDDITNGGKINLPATPGTFYLAHIADANTRTTATYNWTPGTAAPDAASSGALTLDATSAPVKWNNLDKTKTHNFAATFAPNGNAAAPNHEKDYLTATATGVAFGAALDFSSMPHANARLSVKLTSDGKTYTDEQLAAATVTATVTKNSACSADGVISFANITKTAVELMTSTTDANTHTAILAPQTLVYVAATTNSVAAPVVSIVITIDGKTYSIKQDVTLTAGKHTVLTAKIVASQVGITVGSADWTTGDDISGGDIEIDK